MIYVRDKGQMCNNILQYGHVYAFARAHGLRSVSMRFAYKYPYFHICSTRGHNALRYLMGKYLPKLGLMPTVSFDTPGEDTAAKEARILASRNVMVQGWEVRFYDLFLRYLDEIKDLFAFIPEVESKAQAVLAKSDAEVKIGIHLRRGDYARWQHGRYFFSFGQYASLIKCLREKKKGRKVAFFVCTNDPATDRRLLAQAAGDAEIYFPAGNPGEDLCVLSKCDMIAGPPSTFSLVASMYSDVPLYWVSQPDKPVEDSDFGRFEHLFRHIL